MISRIANPRGTLYSCAAFAGPTARARVRAWQRAGPTTCIASVGGSDRRRYECTKSASRTTPPGSELPVLSRAFWSSRATWRRAGVNTFRCLVGCTTGDFAAMWYLQAYHADLGMGTIMGLSMASGLAASFALETALLKLGRDGLATWGLAARTAAGMSLLSMVTMEAAENAVDWRLTGGVVSLGDPWFWGAAAVSVGAGFLAPLPWNYYRLRRLGKACH